MKRDIFAELTEGFEALAEEREGKVTLRKHTVKAKPAPTIKPGEIAELRKKLNLSQPVFADILRTKVKTLRNWEQGVAKPNSQAAVLIKLVEKEPDIIEHLAAV